MPTLRAKIMSCTVTGTPDEGRLGLGGQRDDLRDIMAGIRWVLILYTRTNHGRGWWVVSSPRETVVWIAAFLHRDITSSIQVKQRHYAEHLSVLQRPE